MYRTMILFSNEKIENDEMRDFLDSITINPGPTEFYDSSQVAQAITSNRYQVGRVSTCREVAFAFIINDPICTMNIYNRIKTHRFTYVGVKISLSSMKGISKKFLDNWNKFFDGSFFRKGVPTAKSTTFQDGNSFYTIIEVDNFYRTPPIDSIMIILGILTGLIREDKFLDIMSASDDIKEIARSFVGSVLSTNTWNRDNEFELAVLGLFLRYYVERLKNLESPVVVTDPVGYRGPFDLTRDTPYIKNIISVGATLGFDDDTSIRNIESLIQKYKESYLCKSTHKLIYIHAKEILKELKRERRKFNLERS